MTDAEVRELIRKYSEPELPKCRVCGHGLQLARAAKFPDSPEYENRMVAYNIALDTIRDLAAARGINLEGGE